MTAIVRDIIGAARPGGAVKSVRRLTGGLSATTHLVRMHDKPDLVVRRFEAAWHQLDGRAARNEAHCLTRLAHSPVSAPTLVWADPDGERFGMAVIVTTRVPGVARARPDRFEWIDGLARELAALHRLRPAPGDSAVLTSDLGSRRPWLNEPPHQELGSLGKRIWPAIRGRFDSYRPEPHVFVHGDYHPGNVLNVRGRVTGVIDWESGMLGPRALDVGYCRMDLALAHGTDVGDAFLVAYARHAGALPADLALFEMVAVVRALPHLTDWMPSWQAQGVTGLTTRLLRRRLKRFAHSTAERM